MFLLLLTLIFSDAAQTKPLFIPADAFNARGRQIEPGWLFCVSWPDDDGRNELLQEDSNPPANGLRHEGQPAAERAETARAVARDRPLSPQPREVRRAPKIRPARRP